METLANIKGISKLIPEDNPSIHALICGEPGTGKTVSAATFPNIIWLALETGVFQQKEMIKHVQGIDISTFHILPFHRRDFVEKFLQDNKVLGDSNKRPEKLGILNTAGAVKHWLRNEVQKIPSSCTLIIDSWTALQEHFDIYQTQCIKYTKNGEQDEFDFWAQKIDFAEAVSSAIETALCNVVVLAHEMKERDKITGRILDKTQPLMQGKFVTKMKKFYGYVFRSKVIAVEDEKGREVVKDGKTVVRYVWQTSSDKEFDAKCPVVGLPMYVDAQYKSLITQKG